jgi:hypothetical protein
MEKEVISEIKTKTIQRLYDDLSYDIKYELNKNITKIVNNLVNNIIGDNIKIKNIDKTITKEEYDELVDRDRKLTALECGGVDNWEWYGESLSQYYDEKEED